MKTSLLCLALAGLLPATALAHPGSGIVVDRLGQVYFVDMVSGIWKLDAQGTLTHLPGSAFHWMTLDAAGRFAVIPPCCSPATFPSRSAATARCTSRPRVKCR
jgi:hypothetical protein